MPNPGHELQPAFLHAMGNALFAVQAQARLGLEDKEPLLQASRRADNLLKVMQALSGQTVDEPVAALLPQTVDLLRYRFRVAELIIELADLDQAVGDTALLCRGMATGVCCLMQGTVSAALQLQVQGRSDGLSVALQQIPGQLPFQADFAAVAAQVNEFLAANVATVEGAGLLLRG